MSVQCTRAVVILNVLNLCICIVKCFYWQIARRIVIQKLVFYYALFLKLPQEIRRRGLHVAVAGIPKTIDNDIAVIWLLVLFSACIYAFVAYLLIWETVVQRPGVCWLFVYTLSGYRQVIWFWYCCRRSPACHQCSSCGSFKCWKWDRVSEAYGSL